MEKVVKELHFTTGGVDAKGIGFEVDFAHGIGAGIVLPAVGVAVAVAVGVAQAKVALVVEVAADVVVVVDVLAVATGVGLLQNLGHALLQVVANRLLPLLAVVDAFTDVAKAVILSLKVLGVLQVLQLVAVIAVIAVAATTAIGFAGTNRLDDTAVKATGVGLQAVAPLLLGHHAVVVLADHFAQSNSTATVAVVFAR